MKTGSHSSADAGQRAADLADLGRRRDFMRLTDENCQAVRSVREIIDRALPGALDRFYDRIRATGDTLGFFSSETVIARARHAQQDHWKHVSGAELDADYAARVARIGVVHARIGLEPRWYIGGYAIVLDRLIHAVMVELLPRRRRWLKKDPMSPERMAQIVGSLCKIVLLEMDLTISVYLDEAERRRQADRAEAIRAERHLVSERFGTTIGRIADRDLSATMGDELPSAYGPLRENLNTAIVSLRDILGTVGDATQQIDMGADEISTAIRDLAGRTETQAASVEKTASAVEQIAGIVSSAAARAAEAENFVKECQVIAERFGAMVARATASMAEIARSSEAIGRIIDVMEGIATRTSLLALNTAVEAARAGEAGNSFKILAQEIRDLATRAGAASKDVRELVGTSGRQVAGGVAVMNEANAATSALIASVREIGRHLEAIAVASQEQAATLHEINGAVTQIDRGTRQNAAMAEQASAASARMAGEAAHLNGLLATFELGLAARPAARPERGR
ncbi:protoglobin domain-containing protein [Gluconacetobacter sacchari]|uniref:Globin-coupled sensor protein n=2 Tax=Gluconacetobacter sacchari TaxID=92759 RepID=A0A7W4NNX9_9PROT|nr:globin-coupled sensor protein [Gluconacetobacter sacchari]MBB2158758.1 globin-coupled sensor protein [Gluconacetobacter sacchari]